jgi:hypothetical protein
MKIRYILMLVSLIGIVAAALILFLPGSNELIFGKAKVDQLPEGQAIKIETRAERYGVQIGDVFSYLVEILYDPGQVSEIDKTGFGKIINLQPFEIRNVTETEFNVDSKTSVYQRQYELQLVDGEVNHLYKFRGILVKYTFNGIKGYTGDLIEPESIYVTARLPEDISNLELGYGPLRPLKGDIKDTSQSPVVWVLCGSGGLLAFLGMGNFSWLAIKRRKKKNKLNIVDTNNVFYQAYKSFRSNISAGCESRVLFHQIDHILRSILAIKENTGWLEEPNLDLISPEIRPKVILLFEKCQAAYLARQNLEQKEVDESSKLLEDIFAFYFTQEISEWKSSLLP